LGAIVFVSFRRWKLKKSNGVLNYQNEGRKSDKPDKKSPPKLENINEAKDIDEESYKPNIESDSE